MKRRNIIGKPLGTLQLPIGKNKFTGKTVFFVERLSFGIHIIGAVTRFGKSVIVKNLYVQIGHFRPVIILDYLGEHSMSRFPNFMSEDQALCLPKLKEFKNFKFKISQFNKPRDWLSLGFTDKASLLMADLSKHVSLYRDEPDLFNELLRDVPISPGETSYFKNKYGVYFPNTHIATVESAKTMFGYLCRQKFFGTAEEPTYDFGDLALQYQYLNINFLLDKADTNKARAIAGKVLEQIERVLDYFYIPPLIVVEEADVLAPNISRQQLIRPSSLELLEKFVLKLQKKKIELIFIVQDLSNLSQTIAGNYHSMILGQLPPDNIHSGITSKLQWDIDNNYREFAYFRKGKNGFEVLIPEDSMSMY